jgi:hypothetical protein
MPSELGLAQAAQITKAKMIISVGSLSVETIINVEDKSKYH